MNDITYNEWHSMSDYSLAQSIGAFVKHHRLQQNFSQEAIAIKANISRSTLSLLEKGETVTIPTLICVLRVLNLLYIMEIFSVENQTSPIQLAEIEQRKRKRASKEVVNINTKTDW